MDVRLAVGYDQHLVAFQVLAQDAAQRVRAPEDLAFVARVALGLEVANQRLQVLGDRPQFGRRDPEAVARAERRLARDQALDSRHPAAPADLGDHHRDQRHHGGDRREQVEDVLLGVLAAPLHEAHVVHDHQLPQRLALGGDRVDRHVQRPALELHQPALRHRLPGLRAAHALWKRAGRIEHLAGRVAEADRENALVLDDALEIAQHLLACARLAHQRGERFLRRIGDGRRADLQVANEPLQRQAIDQRHYCVGDRRERDSERNDEAKG